jgi:hypothetical protein
MKTKVITLFTPQLKEDLTYAKYCEFPTYYLKKTPENIDIEKTLNDVRNQAISSSVDGKIISVTSKLVPSKKDFVPVEEITITYESNSSNGGE